MNCSCHGQHNRICQPQYNGAECPGQICNVHLGGVISKNRPQTKWTDEPVTNNTFIKLAHLTELRTALNKELSVRGLSAVSWSNPGQYFSSTQWTQIKNAINSCRKKDGLSAFTWTDSYASGQVISYAGMIYMRQFVNVLQNVCMCDCNYDCACNCNYCTCNCNYCICDCNWNCPCNCNYSDERLKEDIEYF